MSTNDLGLTGDTEPLTESFARAKEEIGAAHHAHGPTRSVRESTYRGHRIVVRTTYEITVDDKPVEGHLGVTNGGQVHYHPVPNLGFPSAIELVETLIDTFPDDFDPPADGGSDDCEPEGEPHADGPAVDDHGSADHDHAGHDHADHDHGHG